MQASHSKGSDEDGRTEVPATDEQVTAMDEQIACPAVNPSQQPLDAARRAGLPEGITLTTRSGINHERLDRLDALDRLDRIDALERTRFHERRLETWDREDCAAARLAARTLIEA